MIAAEATPMVPLADGIQFLPESHTDFVFTVALADHWPMLALFVGAVLMGVIVFWIRTKRPRR